MQKIRVELGDRSYNIIIDNNILKDIGRTLEKFGGDSREEVTRNFKSYISYLNRF